MAAESTAEICYEGSFELAGQKWRLFIPDGARGNNVQYRIYTSDAYDGENSLLLHSDKMGRCGIYPVKEALEVHPGEKFKASLYYKATTGLVIKPETPGVVIRVTFFDSKNQAMPQDAIFICEDGIQVGGLKKKADYKQSNQWKPIIGSFSVPPSCAKMVIFAFLWEGMGDVLLDNIRIVRLPNKE